MRQKASLVEKMYEPLLYGDIFDYPLTGEQLFHYSPIPLKRKEFLTLVKMLPHAMYNGKIYYFLPRKQKNILQRIQKEKISMGKLTHVKRIVAFLQYIPTIQGIGISGSLALMQADKKSDSDLFFITKKNTVWLTRLVVYLLLFLFGVKRQQTHNESAICANMFVAENALKFAKIKRNMYTAHEISQVIPLVNRNNVFENFLYENKWITTYFPNKKIPKKIKHDNSFSLFSLLLPLEYVARVAQILYMEKKKTRETVTADYIAFHPIDYEKIVLSVYEKKKKHYGV